ncbi:MAG: NAD-dependent epimerase/dehydratase family protein [Gemmataceae bacterium]|nr:NAD-dependent epimerase/dehydratase family protein [Gemmataceae bacterium]
MVSQNLPLEISLPPERLPVLVTGVTGVPGFNAFTYLREKYGDQVIGVRPVDSWRMVGEGIHGVDPDDAVGMNSLFRKFGFGSILNATGSCALRACELDPKMAIKTNVASAGVIAGLSQQFNSRLVHVSTDLVFSGQCGQGQYLESSSVDPVTNYGKTMVEGERIIAAEKPSAVIGRISLPMGPSFNGHAGAIDWIESRFRKTKPATLYFDEVRSPAYVEDLNQVFEILLGNDFSGIYHLGGPRAVSLYQIGQIVNLSGGYPSSLLQGCPRLHAGPIPPRAGNVSMNSNKLLSALGRQPFHPWPRDESLVPTCKDWHHHRGEIPGSRHYLASRLYRHSAIVPNPNDYYLSQRFRLET